MASDTLKQQRCKGIDKFENVIRYEHRLVPIATEQLIARGGRGGGTYPGRRIGGGGGWTKRTTLFLLAFAFLTLQ